MFQIENIILYAMKKKILFLILSSTLLFASCSESDDYIESSELTPGYISQTSWSGEYIVRIRSLDQIYQEYNFGITFYDGSSGSYAIYNKDDGTVFNQNHFTYKVNKKILTIYNVENAAVNLLIAGEWFLLDKEQNKMSLVRNLETGYFIDYLYLEKAY